MSNLGWFIGGIFGAISAYDKFRPKPPLHRQFVGVDAADKLYLGREEAVKNFLSRAEADSRLDRLSKKIDTLGTTISASISELRKERAEESRSWTASLNEVFQALGRLRGKVEHDS